MVVTVIGVVPGAVKEHRQTQATTGAQGVGSTVRRFPSSLVRIRTQRRHVVRRVRRRETQQQGRPQPKRSVGRKR